MSAPVKRNGYIDNNTTVYARSVVDSELAAPFRSEYDFELTGEGTIFANGLQIVFNEYGLVYGEINGVPGRCSSRATSVWTR